jgi:hypothetical protein
MNISHDTVPTFTKLRKWGRHASVNCHLCGNMVKQTLFHVLVHCKQTMDQERTWKHNSVLNHTPSCLKSALVGQSTIELYFDSEGLQVLGGELIPTNVLAHAQRLNLVMLDRLVDGLHRITLVELTCSWDTDAKKAEQCKASKYSDLNIAFKNEGWDCNLYMIKVGVRGHILKLSFPHSH